MIPRNDTAKQTEKSVPQVQHYDPATSHFRILDTQLHYSTAASNDLFISVFHNETQASALVHMLTDLDKMARSNKGVVNLLNVIRPGAPMPNEAARKALIDVFQYVADQGARTQSAVVFEGSGATASIIRSVVTGLSFLAKTMLPIKVFATVEDAIVWLEPTVSSIESRDSSQVKAVISELDRLHDKLFAKKKAKSGTPS